VHTTIPPPTTPHWQVDQHVPALTVRETLRFAEACLGPLLAAKDVTAHLVKAEAAMGVERTEDDKQVRGGGEGAFLVRPFFAHIYSYTAKHDRAILYTRRH
jgi:hypothetical protein